MIRFLSPLLFAALLVAGTAHAQTSRSVASDTISTKTGLRYVISSKGKGAKPKAGEIVLVHYTGALLDGKVFDSSRERGEPIAFMLGQGQVIKGWDEGISLLRVGDKARLIIPSDLAYGERAVGDGLIPANSTLVFDVELVDIKAKSVGPALGETIEKKGIKAAVKQFAAMKKSGFKGYHMSENELNMLGYRLLGAGKTAEAMEILKLNVEMYPKSFNVYDSYGEACMKHGDTELAIANYRKSLELNPENDNATKMIEQMTSRQ